MAKIRPPCVVIAAASTMFAYGALLLTCVFRLGLAMQDPTINSPQPDSTRSPGHLAVGMRGRRSICCSRRFRVRRRHSVLSNIVRYVTYLVWWRFRS